MNTEGNRAAGRLTERSVRYLLDASAALEHPKPGSGADAEAALEYGQTLFAQINSLLKVALDRSDVATFRHVEGDWQEIPDTSLTGELKDSRLAPLVGYRKVQIFGLAMWAVHLIRKKSMDGLAEDAATEVLRLLSGRFNGIEDAFDSYDRASDREEKEEVPWTNWFLSELPDGKAHYIPTADELLFTALLLGVNQTGVGQVTELKPRAWFSWRKDEVGQALGHLREQRERWALVLGLTAPAVEESDPAEAVWVDWEARITLLEKLIDDARGVLSEREREAVRHSPLDPSKVSELKSSLLREASERRLIRHIFAAQGALRQVSAPPPRLEERVARNWIPKNFLTAESRVLGIEMAGRDLARVNLNEEVEQLLGALPEIEPREGGDENELAEIAKEEVERMREMGLGPTLMLIPIAWRLREALGLPPIGASAALADHPLVPAAKAKEFAGVFEEVAVLDAPQVPEDILWIIDLADAEAFLEWPSEKKTGMQLKLKEFSAEEAAELLEENPRFAGEKDPTEAAHWLQENVLLEQRQCWTIEVLRAEAATALKVPESLVFKG